MCVCKECRLHQQQGRFSQALSSLPIHAGTVEAELALREMREELAAGIPGAIITTSMPKGLSSRRSPSDTALSPALLAEYAVCMQLENPSDLRL